MTDGVNALIPQYQLLVRQQLTVGRILLGLALGAPAILLAGLINYNVERDVVDAIVAFLSVYGLGLSVPVLSLVLASSALGELVEDETLVYLWLRPNPRWTLAVAAWLAAATVAVPANVVPLTLAAAVGTGGDPSTTVAVATSMGLATVAYTGVFTFLGLIIRRSLIVGLVYVFIWELFVARVGLGAARLSINTYPASVLAHLTDLELPLAERSLTNGFAVPVVVTVVALALTTWRLDRANVA